MSRASSPLSFDELSSLHDVLSVVDHVFDDPQVRLGIGWTSEDDPDEAKQAIRELFERRFEQGWSLHEVTWQGQRAGLAGLGPMGADGSAWYAIYLLERGEGLGHRVTEHFVDRARERRIDELVAVTWAENEASRGLLEAHGFELAGSADYEWAHESQLSWVEYRREVEEGT